MTTRLLPAVLLLVALGGETDCLPAQRPVDMRRAATPNVSVRLLGNFAELHIRGWKKDSIALVGSVPNDAKLGGGFGGGATVPTATGKFYLETSTGAPGGKLE